MTLKEFLEQFPDHAEVLNKQLWVEHNGDIFKVTEVEFPRTTWEDDEAVIVLVADEE